MGEKIKKAIGVEGDFKSSILPMINYSYTNMFIGGAGYIISMYFTIFLTDVVNISLRQASTVVMIATIWDAVTDPVMGMVTDRTRSKYGKHRRYLLWGIPLLLVSYSLLWNSYGINGKENPTGAMVYFILVYMLYKTAFTVISVPHTAMLPELAPEYNLRTQYNSVGYLFNSAGMVPAFGIVVLILALCGSGDDLTSASKKPFLIIGIILSVFFSAAVFMTFKTTREQSSLDIKNKPLDIKYVLREYVLVFKNRSFRQYFFMSLAYQFATGFYNNSKVYYIKYLANQYNKYALFNAVAGVAEAGAFPLNYALTMKYGKKKCGNIVTPLMLAGLAIGLIMQRSGGNGSLVWVLLMLLSMVLYPFGMSGLGFVSTNIFPDLTDVDELITGRRREGVIATFSTLIKKSISGVMAAMVGFTLQGFGLVTGDTVSQYEKTTGEIFAQSGNAILGVRICVAVIPIISAVISLYLLKKFKMTGDDHTMIRAAVATKHKYGTVTLSSEEIERCELISGQKFEDTWLGQNNNPLEEHRLDKNEDGKYLILIEKENEKKQLEEAENTQKKG